MSSFTLNEVNSHTKYLKLMAVLSSVPWTQEMRAFYNLKNRSVHEKWNIIKSIGHKYECCCHCNMGIRGGADKSLARPGRKQATATKLGIYSTYSPRSPIHCLASCSNFCKTLKKNSEGCLSNQVSAATMTSVSDEKWRPFNCFFSPGNRW